MSAAPHTDARSLDAAKDRYRGDWDEGGTVAVVLPRDVAERLLAERGWFPEYATANDAPSGVRVTGWWEPQAARSDYRFFHDTDEALRLALTAENV